ncbi:DDE_3 domain-containing protein [Trichonephila clavipes]|nr:DDE_3 domain-containing protein [Trichonephila clavipes]
MVFYVVELLDDWNVDVPNWKYPRNLESPRVSSPGFGKNSKMMVITRMDWLAYSPDLNSIEHAWDMLGRRIAARQPPPTCLPELRRALLDEWCNIPQDQTDNLILSMPRRCYPDKSRSWISWLVTKCDCFKNTIFLVNEARLSDRQELIWTNIPPTTSWKNSYHNPPQALIFLSHNTLLPHSWGNIPSSRKFEVNDHKLPQ